MKRGRVWLPLFICIDTTYQLDIPPVYAKIEISAEIGGIFMSIISKQLTADDRVETGLTSVSALPCLRRSFYGGSYDGKRNTF